MKYLGVWEKYTNHVTEGIKDNVDEPAVYKSFIKNFSKITKDYVESFNNSEDIVAFGESMLSFAPADDAIQSDLFLDFADFYMKTLEGSINYTVARDEYMQIVKQTTFATFDYLSWFEFEASFSEESSYVPLESNHLFDYLEELSFKVKSANIAGKTFLFINKYKLRYVKEADGYVITPDQNTIRFLKTKEYDAKDMKFFKKDKDKTKYSFKTKSKSNEDNVNGDGCLVVKNNNHYEMIISEKESVNNLNLKFTHEPFDEIKLFGKAIAFKGEIVAKKAISVGKKHTLKVVSNDGANAVLKIKDELFSLTKEENDIFVLTKYDSANDKVKIVNKAIQVEKRLVYGIVSEPNVIDAQDDIMDVNTIEKAAHMWLSNFGEIGFMHYNLVNKKSIEVVESFIAPIDFKYEGSDEVVTKGSWVLVIKVNDENYWNMIKTGAIRGFSIGATGKSTEVK